MKYSFMSFSTPELSLDEMLALAKKLGYDGIEPRLRAHVHGIGVTMNADTRRDIRHRVVKSGVALACLATSCQYADPEKNKEAVFETHERIDLAGDLAVSCIRVFGGSFPEDISREEAIDSLVKALSKVAKHAAERGVAVCLETHDAWCNPKHVAEVLTRVNHPAIGVNWDVLHPVRMGFATIEESFETLKPWIRHLHIHDGKKGGQSIVPIGTGDIDHKRTIELLQGISFDGYLSGEWINWEPYKIHLPRELAILKEYERELHLRQSKK